MQELELEDHLSNQFVLHADFATIHIERSFENQFQKVNDL